MGFDGITLQGHALKVRRPKDYKAVAEDNTSPANIPNIVSTNVQEGPNKIFIGGLPSYLDEEQVKQLVSAFGQLKSFNLVKDSQTGVSKGFAFFEYLDPSVTDRACTGMNGMKIGEKSVLAQRANIGAKHTIAPTPNAESILSNPTAYNFLNLQMPIAAAAALMGFSQNDAGNPTRIVILGNIASPDELLNEEEYNNIIEDVWEEMRKYGTVVSVAIPKPPKPIPKREEENMIQDQHAILPTEVHWGVGRAFVEFKRKEDAERAQKSTGGKKFNGRFIVTGFYSESKYTYRDWLPEPEEEARVAEKFRREKDEKDLAELEKIRRALQEDVDEMEAQEQMNKAAENRDPPKQ